MFDLRPDLIASLTYFSALYNGIIIDTNGKPSILPNETIDYPLAIYASAKRHFGNE